MILNEVEYNGKADLKIDDQIYHGIINFDFYSDSEFFDNSYTIRWILEKEAIDSIKNTLPSDIVEKLQNFENIKYSFNDFPLKLKETLLDDYEKYREVIIDVTKQENFFDYIRDKKISLININIETSLFFIEGNIEEGLISVKGGEQKDNLYSISTINKLFNLKPECLYHSIRISPVPSVVKFKLKSKNPLTSINKTNDNYLESIIMLPKNTKDYFVCSIKNTDIGNVYISCTDGLILVKILKIQVPSEKLLMYIRVSISFLFGAVLNYGIELDNETILINFIKPRQESILKFIFQGYESELIIKFILYLNKLNDADFSKLESSIFTFLDSKTGQVTITTRLVLIFHCAEMLISKKDGDFKDKLIPLFNTHTKNSIYAKKQNSINLALSRDSAITLRNIRNAIIHEGIQAEHIYNYLIKNPNECKDSEYLHLSKDGGISLWKFLLGMLDKFFLNLILFEGEYIDWSDDYKKKKSKIFSI